MVVFIVMCDLDDLDGDKVGSHGVLPGPLPRHVIVLGLVRLVNARDLRHQRIVRVGVTQQGADG